MTSVGSELRESRERRAPALTYSDRVLQVAAMFDLDLESNIGEAGAADGARLAARVPLPQAGIVLITGPSGGGKTMLLGALARHVRTIHLPCFTMASKPIWSAAAVIDCFDDLPQKRALSILARAGLAEARLLVRPPHLLSEGERFRLALARLFADADHESPVNSGRAILLADEFCSCLDRAAARTIARGVRKWIDSSPHTFIAASAQDDLLESLDPDVLVIASLDGSMKIHERPTCTLGAAARDCGEDITIEDGATADYDALAAYHYRAGRPATIERIFRAVRRGRTIVGRYLNRRIVREVIGVLVRSYPTLSCTLRDRALSGRYRGLRQRERARIISREVRTISRVVIEPRYRGAGLASRLVRHALQRPASPVTDALAAMGGTHPFFEQAGMKRFDGPPRAPDLRLLDALAAAGVAPRGALDLVLSDALAQRIEGLDAPSRAWVERELSRWMRADDALRRTRRCTNGSPRDPRCTLQRARRSIASRPIYYLALHEDWNAHAHHHST